MAEQPAPAPSNVTTPAKNQRPGLGLVILGSIIALIAGIIALINGIAGLSAYGESGYTAASQMAASLDAGARGSLAAGWGAIAVLGGVLMTAGFTLNILAARNAR